MSRLKLASPAKQTGLNLSLSETPKPDFLAVRPNRDTCYLCFFMISVFGAFIDRARDRTGEAAIPGIQARQKWQDNVSYRSRCCP